MDRATFWSTKSPLPEYQAIVFEHPALGDPVRLVANQFAAVTLGGYSHIPAAMQIKRPEVTADPAGKLTLAFPRAAYDPVSGRVLGREFKRALREIQASGSREPIVVRYSIYHGETATAGEVWSGYAAEQSGIVFTADTVQVTATVDNPMRRGVAEIYDPGVFTGLELI